MSSTECVGLIGLGEMGYLMAERLLAAGVQLLVHNRTMKKADPLVEKGAVACLSPRQVAEQANVVLLCLFDAAGVESVVFGQNGVAEAAREGHLLVDLSTCPPTATRELSRRVRQACGATWLDAPVSGGAQGAAAGTLAVMAGGETRDFDRARPLLSLLGSHVTHVGGTGCGQAAKACNQIINFGNAVAVAEAMSMASRFGLDPRLLPVALAGGFADSGLLRHIGPRMAAGTYSGNTALTMKDINIALELGAHTASPMPLMGVIAGLYQLLVSRGHVGDGIGGIARLYSDGPMSELYSSAVRLERAPGHVA